METATGSVSGCNLSWEQVASLTYGSRRRIYVWRGTGASPSTGSLTIAVTSGGSEVLQEVLWSVDEATGVEGADPDDTPALNAQLSVTSLELTGLGTPGTDDHFYAAFAIEGASVSATVDDGTALTNLGGGANVRTLVVFYDADHSDSSPSIQWTGSNSAGGIGFIVNATSVAEALTMDKWGPRLEPRPRQRIFTVPSGFKPSGHQE